MEHAFSDLDAIYHVVDLSIDSQNSCVVLLTTRSWIERTLIKNDQVTLREALFVNIVENFDDRGLKI